MKLKLVIIAVSIIVTLQSSFVFASGGITCKKGRSLSAGGNQSVVARF